MRDPIPLSKLGFGCASVMGKVGRREALRAMNQAFDLGVTHFDVARSYGFGRAEQVLGTFVKGRRDKVTISTKFGVVPPELDFRVKAVMPVARVLRTILPGLKEKMRSKSGELLANRNFEPGYARKCLDRSLGELQTDCIDIYLLHEPDYTSLGNFEELQAFMEECITHGKIRRWGFAYGTPRDHAWGNKLGGDIIQYEGNLDTLGVCSTLLGDCRQHIVMRPFAGGQITGAGSAELDAGLRKLGATLADFSLYVAGRLAGISGCVVCSMFSPEHIRSNARSLDLYSGNDEMAKMFDSVFLAKIKGTMP